MEIPEPKPKAPKLPRWKRFLLSKYPILLLCFGLAFTATMGWAKQGNLWLTIFGYGWCAFTLWDLLR